MGTYWYPLNNCEAAGGSSQQYSCSGSTPKLSTWSSTNCAGTPSQTISKGGCEISGSGGSGSDGPALYTCGGPSPSPTSTPNVNNPAPSPATSTTSGTGTCKSCFAASDTAWWCGDTSTCATASSQCSSKGCAAFYTSECSTRGATTCTPSTPGSSPCGENPVNCGNGYCCESGWTCGRGSDKGTCSKRSDVEPWVIAISVILPLLCIGVLLAWCCKWCCFKPRPIAVFAQPQAKMTVRVHHQEQPPQPQYRQQQGSPAAVHPSPPQPPSQPQWRPVSDPASGKTYYVNSVTNEVSWNPPPLTVVQSPPPPPPPPPQASQGQWRAVTDPSGRTYYYNSATNETSWNPPPQY